MSARATYFVKQGAAVRCVNKQVSHTFYYSRARWQPRRTSASSDHHAPQPVMSEAEKLRFWEQLEIVPGPLSKIGDGYATRKTRPRGAAVFDF